MTGATPCFNACRAARPLRVLVLSIAVLLGACGEVDPREAGERAREALAADDYRTAVIEYRRLLQVEPENDDARLGLGIAFARMGDPEQALREFGRVSTAAAPDATVRREMAGAYLELRQPEQALETLGDPGTSGDDSVSDEDLLRARAYLQLGRVEPAMDIYLRVDPADEAMYSRSLVGRAAAAAQQGDPAHAISLLDMALELRPGYLDALELRADNRMSTGAYEEAVADLKLVVDEAMRSSNPARLGRSIQNLLAAQLASGYLDEAEETVSRISQGFPGAALEFHSRALLAQALGDFDTAHTESQKALSLQPEHVPYLLLHATMAAADGKVGQAEQSARKALMLEPENARAARLLAAVYMQQSRFDDAEETLARLVTDDGTDLQLIVARGYGALERGDVRAAIVLLERGLSLDPNNSMLRSGLARAHTLAGDDGKAAAALSVMFGNPDDTELLEALLGISRAVQQGDLDSGRREANALVESYPNRRQAWLALAVVERASGNSVRAEAAATRALQIDADFVPALQFRASVRQELADVSGALADLGAVLAARPDDAASAIRHAAVLGQSGDTQAATTLLERFLDAHPEAVDAAVALSRMHLASGDIDDAARVLRRAREIDENDRQVQMLAAQIDHGAGRRELALQSMVSLARRFPDDIEVLQLLARMQLANTDFRGVLDTLDGVEDLLDRIPALLSLRCRALLGARQADAAAVCAERLIRRVPGSAEANSILGLAQLGSGNRAAAAGSFRRAYETTRSGEHLVRLAGALAADQPETVEKLLKDHLSENPDDVDVAVMLGQVYLANDKTDLAVSRYEHVVRNEPDSVTALNNLAWLLRDSDPGRAEAMVRRALDLAPGNSHVQDTAGWILLNNGKVAESVELLRKAAGDRSNDPQVLYHLAVAEYRSGDVTAARRTVQRALQSGGSFDGREEAEELREQLN